MEVFCMLTNHASTHQHVPLWQAKNRYRSLPTHRDSIGQLNAPSKQVRAWPEYLSWQGAKKHRCGVCRRSCPC